MAHLYIYRYYRLLIHSSHCFTGKLPIKIHRHSNYNGTSEHELLDSNPDFAYFLLVLALFEECENKPDLSCGITV